MAGIFKLQKANASLLVMVFLFLDLLLFVFLRVALSRGENATYDGATGATAGAPADAASEVCQPFGSLFTALNS
jgi:hypothetical protein